MKPKVLQTANISNFYPNVEMSCQTPWMLNASLYIVVLCIFISPICKLNP